MHRTLLGRPESLLGDPQFASLVAMFTGLWSRGYDGTRAVVVKATSSTGRVAGRLLAASSGLPRGLPERQGRALSRDATRRGELGDGPARPRARQDAAPACGPRAAGLRRCTRCRSANWPPSGGWWRAFRARTRGVRMATACCRSTSMNSSPMQRAASARVLAQFGLPLDAGFLATIAQSPVLRQYSKAPELPFPPEERGARLAQSRRDNREEISKGLAWLDRLARADGSIAALLAQGAA